MPRFVLLYHDCPPDYARASHWDLMLESGDVLRTWALAALPKSWEAWRARTAKRFPNCAAVADKEAIEAEALGDHRREYLELEGEVSGGRGVVMRVASGEYNIQEAADVAWLVLLCEAGVTRRIGLEKGARG